MNGNELNVSRRRFVAGAAGAALTAGLAGCSPATNNSNNGESLPNTAPEKTAYDMNEGEWIPTTCNMCFNN